jgi:hypothetical protein
MTLKELGAAAGGMDYVAVAAVVRRIEARSRAQPDLCAALKRLK